MKIKPLNVFKISMLYVIMFSSVACKKNDSEKPNVTTKEELKNNAQFNDTIIKGAGNLLIQERRTPNNDAEHLLHWPMSEIRYSSRERPIATVWRKT